MQVLKTLEISNISNCTHDGVVAYCLITGSNTVVSIDIDTLTIIGQYAVPRLNDYIKPACDYDFLYVADLMGSIVKIDKYSGVIKKRISIGQSVPISDIVVSQGRLYVLCKTPLSYGVRIDVQKMCLVEIDTETEQRIYQSKIVPLSTEPNLSVLDECVYFSSGKKLYSYKNDLNETDTSFTQTYQNAAVEGYLLSTSKIGSIEVFNAERKTHARFLISKNKVAPILFQNNMVWVTDVGVYQVDPIKRTNRFLSNVQEDLCSQFVLNDKLNLVFSKQSLEISEDVKSIQHDLIQTPNSFLCSKDKALHFYDNRIVQLGSIV